MCIYINSNIRSSNIEYPGSTTILLAFQRVVHRKMLFQIPFVHTFCLPMERGYLWHISLFVSHRMVEVVSSCFGIQQPWLHVSQSMPNFRTAANLIQMIVRRKGGLVHGSVFLIILPGDSDFFYFNQTKKKKRKQTMRFFLLMD